MKNNGYTVEKYWALNFVFLAIIPSLVIIISTIIYLIDDGNCNDVTGKIRYILLIILGVSILLGILNYFIGKRMLRKYATQIIEGASEISSLEEIKLCHKGIKFAYVLDKNEVEQKFLNFSDYRISVKEKTNFATPTFFSRDGVINRVVLPYSKEEGKTWDEYNISYPQPAKIKPKP